MAPNIFISYSTHDRAFVRRLVSALRDRDATVWIDHASISTGDSLIEAISEALYNADFLVAVLSPRSVASPWVQKELSLALTREVTTGRLTVLPVLIEQCQIPALLADKKWADFTYPEVFDLSITRLCREMGLPDHPSRPAVSHQAPAPKATPATPLYLATDDGESATTYAYDYELLISFLRHDRVVGMGMTKEAALEDASMTRARGHHWRRTFPAS